jgi:myo-inositol-1(or 4)-monophosphatase
MVHRSTKVKFFRPESPESARLSATIWHAHCAMQHGSDETSRRFRPIEQNMSSEPPFAFLHALADAADAVTLPRFRTPIEVDDKGGAGFDPVTAADREAEQAMRRLIGARYPDHGIAGEEFADIRPDARFVWHLDPIDGTRQFISGVPLWGTMAGLAERGVPRLGMVSQPFTGERFLGDGRRALHMRGGEERAMRARACPALAGATLFTTSPHLFRGRARAGLERLEAAVRLVRYGIDCYAFALLAMGFVDLVVESGLDDHDIVPLVPIVEGAGGVVVDFEGRPARGGGDVLAAGDPALVEPALALLRT